MTQWSVLGDPITASSLSWDQLRTLILHESFVVREEGRPRSALGRLDMRRMRDEEIVQQSRFARHDMPLLRCALGLPATFTTTTQGVSVGGDEALCIALRRLAYHVRLCDLERLFGRHASTLSLIASEVLTNITTKFEPLLMKIGSYQWLTAECLDQFATGIQAMEGAAAGLLGLHRRNGSSDLPAIRGAEAVLHRSQKALLRKVSSSNVS